MVTRPLAVAHLDWGGEVQHLYPPAIYALGLRHDGDKPPVPLAEYQARLAAPKAGLSPSCALPVREVSADIADNQSPVILASALFPPQQHEAITRAGKANGTSVTGIVAGVLALLSSKHNVTPDAKSAAIWGAAVDRRAGLPERYRPFYQQCIWSKTVLLGNMAAIRRACDAFEQRGEIGEEFWEVCREFKADLDTFAVSCVLVPLCPCRDPSADVQPPHSERRAEPSHVARAGYGRPGKGGRIFSLRGHRTCAVLLQQLW